MAQDIEQTISYEPAVTGPQIVSRTEKILCDNVSRLAPGANEVEQLNNMTDQGSSSQWNRGAGGN